MTQKFDPTNRDQQYLSPPSIQDWLPEKNLARFVVDIISHSEDIPTEMDIPEEPSRRHDRLAAIAQAKAEAIRKNLVAVSLSHRNRVPVKKIRPICLTQNLLLCLPRGKVCPSV